MGLRARLLRTAIFLLAAAGGTGLLASSLSPWSPSPFAGSTPVLQYLYTADSASHTVTGYRINSDGTLAAIPGSPFDVGGARITGTPRSVRAAGATLIVGAPPLWAFNVDASRGAIQKSDEVTPGPLDLAVDSSGQSVYEITQDPGFSRSLKFMQLNAGKFQFRSQVNTNVAGVKLAIDPLGRFLYFAAVSRPGGPPGIELYRISRQPDGSLAPEMVQLKSMCNSVSGETVNAMTAFSGSGHKAIYATCAGTQNLVEYFVLDNTGALLRTGDVSSNGNPQGVAVDPRGRFLFVANADENTVDVYAIDPTTGALSSVPVQRERTGNGPAAIAFDSTGKFMYVANGGCLAAGACAPGSNDISAFSFDGSTLHLIGVFPAGQRATSITVLKP